MKPTIGRIVHFVQKKNPRYGDELVHLPAIIVSVHSDTCVNLQVFTDGSNSEEPGNNDPASVKRVTSATLNDAGDQPYTWHWPERE